MPWADLAPENESSLNVRIFGHQFTFTFLNNPSALRITITKCASSNMVSVGPKRTP